MRNLHLAVLTGLLAVVSLALFAYKVLVLGFPLVPLAETEIWTVQARFTVDAERGPVKVVLQIPGSPPGFTVLDENFVSRDYGLSVMEESGSRAANWSVRRATGRQTLYYRAVVAAVGPRDGEDLPPSPVEDPSLEEPFKTAARTLVEAARSRSADVSTFTSVLLQRLNDPTPEEDVELLLSEGRSPGRKARIAALLLATARVPARVVYGLELRQRQRYATFEPWLEVHDGKRWLFFDPSSGAPGLAPDFLLWWRGDEPLIRVRGASNPEVEVSVWGSATEALEVAERRASLSGSRLVEFSLLGLPVQTQAVYAVLLLIPVGAFIMVLLRNVVGVQTFGTFMPVLIALAFRETRLLAGLVLFAAVTLVGLSLRFYLERLRLLVVPRLASVLVLVVLILAGVSVLSNRLGLETGLSVALFPIVILAMAIERMSIVWEERGPGEAFQEGAGTLLVASLAYLVMSLDLVEHLVFVFPELLLLLLAATLLLGRYRGYRLVELVRFRVLGES